MTLLVEYGLNEGAGTAVADSSGNGKNGVAAGAMWQTPGRNSAGAYVGDGTTAREVDVPDLGVGPDIEQGTIMFWIRPQSLGSTATIFSFGSINSTIALQILNFSGVDRYQWSWWYAQPQGALVPVTNDAWQHVAMTITKDSATAWTARFYKDGVLALTDTGNFGTDGVLIPVAGTLRLGRDGLRGFLGILDDFRLFDTPLSQAEITTYMNQTVGAAGPTFGATRTGDVGDRELGYYLSQGGSPLQSLTDLRRASQTKPEFQFWSEKSGLTPAASYSLVDHRRAAMLTLLGEQPLGRSAEDIASKFWGTISSAF